MSTASTPPPPPPAATAGWAAGWRRTACDGRIALDQPRHGRARQQGPHLRQGPLRAPVRPLARPPHRAARARGRRLPARLLGGGHRAASPPRSAASATTHGPDAIAGLASSRATNEDCYVMQRLMRAAIGTHNIDNCSRVCHSPTSFALRKSFGLSGATGSFDDIEAAEVALIIGANPTAGHPVVGRAHQAGRPQGPQAHHGRPAPHRAGRLRRSCTSAPVRAPTRRCSTGWPTWSSATA